VSLLAEHSRGQTVTLARHYKRKDDKAEAAYSTLSWRQWFLWKFGTYTPSCTAESSWKPQTWTLPQADPIKLTEK